MHSCISEISNFTGIKAHDIGENCRSSYFTHIHADFNQSQYMINSHINNPPSGRYFHLSPTTQDNRRVESISRRRDRRIPQIFHSLIHSLTHQTAHPVPIPPGKTLPFLPSFLLKPTYVIVEGRIASSIQHPTSSKQSTKLYQFTHLSINPNHTVVRSIPRTREPSFPRAKERRAQERRQNQDQDQEHN